MSRKNELSAIVDGRKLILCEELSLERILREDPCLETLVKAIKTLPEKLLFDSIDPNDCVCDECEKRFKGIMKKLISFGVLGEEIIDFLDSCGIVYEGYLTEEEEDRLEKNRRRRLARARAKKQSKSK